MTHASIPKAERDRRGFTDSLLRLSVGIESARDLIADLRHALEATHELAGVGASMKDDVGELPDAERIPVTQAAGAPTY